MRETTQASYNGEGPPRVVLVSPIAFEDTVDDDLPDAGAINERLARYTEAMAEVADEAGVGFVDLFAPTRDLFAATDERLTLNGAHLNDAGYRALAPILDRALFGQEGARPRSTRGSGPRSPTRTSTGGTATGPSTATRSTAPAARPASTAPTATATSWSASGRSSTR